MTYTLAPWAARALAQARPIPLEPPVTAATSPANPLPIVGHPS